MRVTSLAQYQKDGKRLAAIVGVLVRYGLADRLQKIEPDFLKRLLGHEDVDQLAKLPLGERVRKACEELGPTFIKIGQILSTRPDIIPRKWPKPWPSCNRAHPPVRPPKSAPSWRRNWRCP